jgi:hypothetical protein
MARRQPDAGALFVLREKLDRRRQSQAYVRKKKVPCGTATRHWTMIVADRPHRQGV